MTLLDALAQITPEDVRQAAALWRQRAPAEFGDLLDATLELSSAQVTDPAVDEHADEAAP